MEGNSLADQVIQANEQEIVEKQSGDKAPDGYYTDDLGLWVELDIRKNKPRFAQYILTRCKKLNPHLHTRGELLFNSHELVRDDKKDIAKLADIPEQLTQETAQWVYKRLMKVAPPLDNDRIVVAKDLIWNMDTCEFENWEGKSYYTVS